MSNTIEIEVPSSLGGITLKQYQRWVKIVEANGDDNKSSFLDKKLVEVFCNVPLADVNNIKFYELSRILDVLKEAFTEDVPELVKRFEIDGVEYGFIPSIQDISTGEYIDTEANLVDWSDVHIAMAALYRPITHVRKVKDFEQYEIEKYNPSDIKSEVMLRAPLDVVMSARVFFYTLSKELLKITLLSLEEKAKREKDILVLKTLEESGDGINRFIQSQEGTHSDLMKQPLYRYFRL